MSQVAWLAEYTILLPGHIDMRRRFACRMREYGRERYKPTRDRPRSVYVYIHYEITNSNETGLIDEYVRGRHHPINGLTKRASRAGETWAKTLEFIEVQKITEPDIRLVRESLECIKFIAHATPSENVNDMWRNSFDGSATRPGDHAGIRHSAPQQSGGVCIQVTSTRPVHGVDTSGVCAPCKED